MRDTPRSDVAVILPTPSETEPQKEEPGKGKIPCPVSYSFGLKTALQSVHGVDDIIPPLMRLTVTLGAILRTC